VAEVRAFSEEHVRDAADLYLRSMRGQNRPSPQSLQDYFRNIFHRNPWVTPDIPSLVYIDDGKLAGFLGVIPRPMQFRGRSIRAAVVAQFMVETRPYRGPAAIELMRHLLRGPQEITFTDGAGEDASLVWVAGGSRVARLYSFNWIRLLRPFEAGRGMFDRMGGASGLLKSVSGLLASPIDALLSRVPVAMLRKPASKYASKPVSAAELFESIQEFGGREPLKPAYTLSDFTWLMSEASKSVDGFLRMMTVHSPDGNRVGSFVYHARPHSAAYVLQIGWRRRDHFPEILTALFEDAWNQGMYAVKGQAIPRFLTQLSEQYCLFSQLNSSVVGHAQDQDLMNSFLLGETGMTRLDGECWLRFPLDTWT
jgi:Acetyltransferase (GNAT) domain